MTRKQSVHMCYRSRISAAIILLSVCAVGYGPVPAQAQNAGVPEYRVDPFWPKVPFPNAWLIQGVPVIDVDDRDHIWAISRSADLRPDESMATFSPQRGDCCVAAPEILEFDAEGNLLLSIHAFAIRVGDMRIIVDTCIGRGKVRPLPEWSALQSRFLEDLASIDFALEAVDRVLCTHLHFDHVGWNTLRKGDAWVPTFPNARYLVGAAEWEYWKDHEDPYAPQAKADSILPIFEAGLYDLVEMDHVIRDEIRLIPTPGHTPGHVSVAIESEGQRAIITGDMFHHPFQFVHPEWKDSADVESERAFRTRSEFLAKHVGGPVLVLGTHFAAPTGGHVVRDGEAYRFAV